jgi:hypothetical protein
VAWIGNTIGSMQHDCRIGFRVSYPGDPAVQPDWMQPLGGPVPNITELNTICLVLFKMNSRIFEPYLAAMDRILVSVMQSH